MTTDERPLKPSPAGVVSLGKDIVALLRDAALFLLAVLLVAFPRQFNSILVSAGFEEGSLVGFKWKSGLVESNKALEDASATIARLQAKNDELAKALSDANAKLNDPEFVQRIARLEQENRRLKESAQQVQATVSQTIESNAPLVAKASVSTDQVATPPRNKSDYSVGVQTLGASDEERKAMNDRLSADGYGLDPLTWSYPAGQRPSWFADRSTVFYYAPSAQSAAEQLARFMKTVTGQEFVVRRGAGLGVEPSRKNVTLFVHYIKT